MTQLYESSCHLPKVPTLPSSGHFVTKHEDSSILPSLDPSWSSCGLPQPQDFHGQALLDFARRSNEAQGTKIQIFAPIGDFKRKHMTTVSQYTQQELDNQAANLFREFLSCPGFHNYRTRRKKKKDDAKWPDFIEFAFFQALVRYPPCGRTQVSNPHILGGKKMGRNELIGHFIEVTTGISRHRKQVSSHLQVIRPYVVDKPILLSCLISPGKELQKWNAGQRQKGRATGTLTTQRISTHFQPTVSSISDFGPQMPGLKLQDLHSQMWSLCEFDMSLRQRSQHTSELSTALHVYTHTTPESRLPDARVEEFRLAYELFPELFQNRFIRPVGTNIIAIEAPFSLPRLMKARTDMELVTYLNLRGPNVPGGAVVDTVTTFFVGPTAKEVQHKQGFQISNVYDSPSQSSYQIPFCSSHWASFLSRLGVNQSRSTSGPSPSCPTFIAKQMDNELRSLTALQQITIRSQQDRKIEHDMTLRWQFRLSGNNGTGAPGTVNWRQVGIPLIETELLSPSEETHAGSFSSLEDPEGSQPTTPDQVSQNMHDDHVKLQSPIELKGEGWDMIDSKNHDLEGAHFSFDTGDNLGLDMSFVPEQDFGLTSAGTEGGFSFADFDYGQVAGSQSQDQGQASFEVVQGDVYHEHGSFETSQTMVMDPSLMGEDWELVTQPTGLGLDLGKGLDKDLHFQTSAIEELQIDPWMTGQHGVDHYNPHHSS